MKILLSYPRSGNHLVRFFIELLTETPTYGCALNPNDIPIYLNTFPESIEFTIQHNIPKDKCYMKYHVPPKNATELIFIVRNPKEVLVRHLHAMNINHSKISYNNYFNCIDYYEQFNGKKICFFYEDIIVNRSEFIEKLYLFLGVTNETKKQYILDNIDKLYILSSKGENRSWDGIKSNGINFYYPQLHEIDRIRFDNYIKEITKNSKYDIIKNKYNL